MKTKFKKLAGIFSLLFAILAFAPSAAKAQCPKIKNGLPCPVEMKIQIFAPMPGCPLCSSIASFIVPAGGSVPVPCGNCTNPCNVVITIVKIGGVAVPAIPIDFSTAGPPGKVIRPVPCSPSGLAHIYYDPISMTFIITS